MDKANDLEQVNDPPDFNAILDNAEAGFIRRGIARYLFSRNPERSVKTHTFLGAPLLRKAIMETYGKHLPRKAFSNYRTDPHKPRAEAALRFAVGGSVANEVFHGFLSIKEIYGMIGDLPQQGTGSLASSVAVTGVNLALVSLQRYNRARMVQRINEELADGKTLDSSYKNWLGIDSRAIQNYQRKKPEGPGPTP